LRIPPIGFLFPHPLGSDLGGVANPQPKWQLRQQSRKPACLPAGFHLDSYFVSFFFQAPIELLGLLAVFQPLFLKLSALGIYKRDLWEARVIITSLYLVCISPIRSLCVSGELDRVSAGGRSHPGAH
jgi:hypothetical protein